MTVNMPVDEDQHKKRSPKCIRAKLTYNNPLKDSNSSKKPSSNIVKSIPITSNNKVPPPSTFTRSILTDSPSPRKDNSPRKLNSPSTEEHTFTKLPIEDPSKANLEEIRSNFVQMKEERDQCSKNLIDFLSQSLKAKVKNDDVTTSPAADAQKTSDPSSPIHLTNNTQVASTTNSNKPFFQPVASNNTRRNTSSAASSRKPYESSMQTKKFMLRQKQNRQTELKKASAQSTFSADERKRRLAELHKNSLNILRRSQVRRKQTSEQPTTYPVEPSSMRTDAAEFVDVKKKKISSNLPIQRGQPKPKGPDRGTILFAIPSANSAVSTIPPASLSRSFEQSEQQISSGTLNSQAKRIGILRRTEPETQAVAISSPMDNYLNAMLSPSSLCVSEDIKSAVTAATSTPNSPRNNLIHSTSTNLSIPNVGLKSCKLNAAHKTNDRSGSSVECDQLHKKSSSSRGDDSKPNHSSNSGSTINVPYWLKPSPLQVYPYNFIMAVRKKLELIANPTAPINSTDNGAPLAADRVVTYSNTPLGRHKRSSNKKQVSRSNSIRPNLLQTGSEHNANIVQAARIPDIPKTLFEDDHAENVVSTASEAPVNAKSISSDLSSMTLNVPDSSRRKYTAPDASDSDGTLSVVSSTILSQSNPERQKLEDKLHSGMDTNTVAVPINIEPIKVSSHAKLSHPFINSHRGGNSREHPLHERQPFTPSDRSSRVDQTNIVDMLTSFNQSLSHAISVNEKLHEALLSKPVSTNSSVYEYSSKFDSPSAISDTHALSELQLDVESSIRSSSLASESVGSSSHQISKDPNHISERGYSTELSKHDSTVSGRQSNSATQSSVILEAPTAKSETSTNTVSTLHTMENIREYSSTQSDRSVKAIQIKGQKQTQNTHATDANNDANSTQSANLSDRQSNKENVSSNINSESNSQISIAKSFTPRKSTSNTSTIQESTIQFKVPDGFYTYREKNPAVIRKKGSSSDRAMPENRTINEEVDLNKSIGSDIFSVFNPIDMMEFSIASTTEVSDHNLSYSTLGMYDQLLKTEKQKSTDLTTLLKIREKALIDRTKGQISWLELQKRRYQKRGLTSEISALKKKQRALLMRLEKERAELCRSTAEKAPNNHHHRNSHLNVNHLKVQSVRRSPHTPDRAVRSQTALKAIDMSANSNMEEMLRRREDELLQRRRNVEHLIQWHQRLDEEEQVVFRMERQLMTRTQKRHKPSEPQRNADGNRDTQIAKIEHSIVVLQSITDQKLSDQNNQLYSTTEHVNISGSKMNRLWRRLTGETVPKFVATQRYSLTKHDIEQLYEEAKLVVLDQFASGPKVLNQTVDSSLIAEPEPHKAALSQASDADEFLVIPSLNLNFTSAEDISSITTDAEGSGSGTGYYFSDYAPSGQMIQDHSVSQKQQQPAVINEIQNEMEDTQSPSTITSTNVSAKSAKPSDEESYTADFIEEPTIADEESTKSTRSDDELQLATDESPRNADLSCRHPKITESGSLSVIDSKNNSQTDQTITDDVQQTAIHSLIVTTNNTVESVVENVSSEEVIHVNTSEELLSPNITISSSSLINTFEVEEHVSSEKENSLEIVISEASLTASTIPSGIEETTDVSDAQVLTLNTNYSKCGVSSNYSESVEECAANEPNRQAETFVENTRDYVRPSGVVDTEKTPPNELVVEIASEAEVLRRQQIEIEQEIKQLEQNAPFIFLREIPNKPPPPYVQPAHGSPMTVIFPSDDRIQEIVYRQVGELFEAGDFSTPRCETNVTNIYERIIPDICVECIQELPVFTKRTHQLQSSASHEQSTIGTSSIGQFNHPLAFFNPPDQLQCMQEHILKRVKKLLRNSSSAPVPTYHNEQQQQHLQPQHSVVPFKSRLVSSKRKRDLVDEILVQEMLEDDAIWTNVDAERAEVLHGAANDVVRIMVEEALIECQRTFNAKGQNRDTCRRYL